MAGGPLIVAPGNGADYSGELTFYVLLVSIAAACGGLLFGYDIGITGGVISMQSFTEKFFPSANGASDGVYCKFDDQMLQLFTSSLFIAGAFSALLGSYTTKRFGRKFTIIIAALNFLIGVGLTTGAVVIEMLVIGRVFLGFGVGFANQSVPLYLSEMAPAKMRGGFNNLFQLAVTIGIFVAQCINFGTSHITEWGWRLSLGLAAVPAIILLLGCILLPDTPNSLVERGHAEEGRQVLQRIRGTTHVDAEYLDIMKASEEATSRANPWLIFTRRYRPQLFHTIVMAALQQLTGINSIMFYVPVIFKSFGWGSDSNLYNAIIIGGINIGATFVAILAVDRLGRKFLLIEGGIQMFVALCIVAGLVGSAFSGGATSVPIGMGIIILIFICVFVSGFAWSWGPLAWLVPNEIQPLETRSIGQAIFVVVNFIFTFIIGQFFLSMMCAMKWGIFLFFAGWVAVSTLYVALLLPETKGIPIEEMQYIWTGHWWWKRYVRDVSGPTTGTAAQTTNPIVPVGETAGVNASAYMRN